MKSPPVPKLPSASVQLGGRVFKAWHTFSKQLELWSVHCSTPIFFFHFRTCWGVDWGWNMPLVIFLVQESMEFFGPANLFRRFLLFHRVVVIIRLFGLRTREKVTVKVPGNRGKLIEGGEVETVIIILNFQEGCKFSDPKLEVQLPQLPKHPSSRTDGSHDCRESWISLLLGKRSI